MKYKLKEHIVCDYDTEHHNEICINCGKRRPIDVRVIKMEDGTIIRPDTTARVTVGCVGPRPGTWLGCKFGNHDFYMDYEIEAI